MLKGKKGVTLVVLVLTVVVMLIIVGVTISSGTDVIRNSQKNRLKTNLYLVRARAEAVLEDYLFDGTGEIGDEEASATQIAEVRI